MQPDNSILGDIEIPVKNYLFKNLVFEGGGIKGLAYVGALKVLEQKQILKNIIRVGGASAGAITALLLGLNYSPDEIKQIIWDMDFNTFLDGTFGYLGKGYRLFKEYGIYRGNVFRKWIGKYIKEKSGSSESTFEDISRLKNEKKFRDIFFIVTNLSTHFEEVFCLETKPNEKLADAVRFSMSIPLFFAAKTDSEGDLYVDGGVLDNYPIKLFDRTYFTSITENTDYYKKRNDKPITDLIKLGKYCYNKETLGFRLDSKQEIDILRYGKSPKSQQVSGVFNYLSALAKTTLESQTNFHLHEDDWHRTIYIDTLGVKTTQFNIDNKIKNDLINSGSEYTNEYFNKYDNPAIVFKNR